MMEILYIFPPVVYGLGLSIKYDVYNLYRHVGILLSTLRTSWGQDIYHGCPN
jgi:hypothetical protein